MDPSGSRLTEAEVLAPALRASLAEQENLLRSTLVLNPVENFPFPGDLAVAAGSLHGLYNTDKLRSRDEQLATDMQFAGRGAIARDGLGTARPVQPPTRERHHRRPLTNYPGTVRLIVTGLGRDAPPSSSPTTTT